VAWALLIGWGRIPEHGGLLGRFAGLPGIHVLIPQSAAVEAFTTHNDPQDRL
jgi:hypothetical protein